MGYYKNQVCDGVAQCETSGYVQPTTTTPLEDCFKKLPDYHGYCPLPGYWLVPNGYHLEPEPYRRYPYYPNQPFWYSQPWCPPYEITC